MERRGKYLGGLGRRGGEELGDLGGELPVQVARAGAAAAAAPSHAAGVGWWFLRLRLVLPPLVAAAPLLQLAPGVLWVLYYW